MAWAVMAMTGMFGSMPDAGSAPRMRAVASSPSMPGIWMSMNTPSKSCASSSFRASSPFPAGPHGVAQLGQHALAHEPVDPVVLHQQQRKLARRAGDLGFGLPLLHRGRRLVTQGKGHMQGGAAFLLGVDAEHAAQQADQPLDDAQPEPGA